jgi:hypothetical protein
MKERDRGLSEVGAKVLELFRREGLHEAFLFFSPASETFFAKLFYRLNAQVSEARESGLSDRIKQSLLVELERVGRGSRDALKVNFEFDSHENVERQFEGDYYLRLR